MNRRKFLKGAATAAVAAALPSAVLGQAAKPAHHLDAVAGKITFNDKLIQEGTREVTKMTLAQAALIEQKNLVESLTKDLLSVNRLFDEIPYEQHFSQYLQVPRVTTCVKPDGVVSRMEFNFDQPLTIAHVEELRSGFEAELVTARIEDLMAEAMRPENSFFPRGRAARGFVPADEKDEFYV